MSAAVPVAQFSRTESEIVAAQYRAWVYPQPVADMAQAVAKGEYWDLTDPSLFRRKLWPRRIEPDDLTILIAGCGTNQAACYAVTNPNCKVVGIDLSETSLGHEAYLKHKHGLENLELFRMSLGDVGSLGRTFDLIVCTGVLHHLPDPDAGLRCLRDVLRPHGVISIMVYGYYPRFGVYMMQEVFRVLDLEQDEVGIEIVKRGIKDVPAWHHVRRYFAIAPDLGYDFGLVDTFLHQLDRPFTVPQILEFAGRNNLKFQSWLDNRDYSISASIMDPQNLLRQRVETLAPAEQWRLVELIAQSLGTHRFLLCHPDKPEADYSARFRDRRLAQLCAEPALSGQDNKHGWAGGNGRGWRRQYRTALELCGEEAESAAAGLARVSRTGPGRSWAIDNLPRLAFLKPHGLRGLLDRAGRRHAANQAAHHGRSAEQRAVRAGGAGVLPPDGGLGPSAVSCPVITGRWRSYPDSNHPEDSSRLRAVAEQTRQALSHHRPEEHGHLDNSTHPWPAPAVVRLRAGFRLASRSRGRSAAIAPFASRATDPVGSTEQHIAGLTGVAHKM